MNTKEIIRSQYQASLEMLAQAISKCPESLWADTLFPNLGPSKEILDAIIPDRPIALVSYDGHSLRVNSLTLERALIRKDTPDPDGNYAFSGR